MTNTPDTVDGGMTPSTDDFAALFEQSAGNQATIEGTVVKGRVIAIEKDIAVIDVGMKTEGRVPLREFSVPGQDNEDGQLAMKSISILSVSKMPLVKLYLSRDKARREESWINLEKKFEANEQVEGIIFNRVKGGFTVDLDGAIAFLARQSQVDIRPVRDIAPLDEYCSAIPRSENGQASW